MLTLTLHSPQVHGFFSVPVDHLHALREIAAHFRGRDLSRAVVVSPDLGYANCRERDVFIIQPLVPPVQENLVELLLMADAARGASAARVTAVMSHYAYARSDKKDKPRISRARPPSPAGSACR